MLAIAARESLGEEYPEFEPCKNLKSFLSMEFEQ